MKIRIVFFLLLISASNCAQPVFDSVYSFKLILTASPGINLFQKERYLGVENNVTSGYSFFLRSMWHPGRRLAIGFMTGYAFLARDEITGFGEEETGPKTIAFLEAIPLQVVVSMQGQRFESGVGMGPYLMMSKIKNAGEAASGKRLELGLTFFSLYKLNLTDNIFIAPELRILYLSYRGIISFMPSVNILFDVYRY